MFVLRHQLEIGFDDDDEDKHQFKHVCWPYPKGALCGSKRLWFQGGALGDYDIDCPNCLRLLREIALKAARLAP